MSQQAVAEPTVTDLAAEVAGLRRDVRDLERRLRDLLMLQRSAIIQALGAQEDYLDLPRTKQPRHGGRGICPGEG